MHEKNPNYGPNVYDDLEGWGEVPAMGIPREAEEEDFKTVRTPTDLRRESTRFGPLRSFVLKYTDKGYAVGLQYKGPKKVRVFVADHRDSIKRVVVAGVTTGVTVGIVYLHEHRKSKK